MVCKYSKLILFQWLPPVAEGLAPRPCSATKNTPLLPLRKLTNASVKIIRYRIDTDGYIMITDILIQQIRKISLVSPNPVFLMPRTK
jgi:hypothetical protein